MGHCSLLRERCEGHSGMFGDVSGARRVQDTVVPPWVDLYSEEGLSR